jgi:hypothetical protein
MWGMPHNGRVYEMKRIVELRLYPTCQTLMQAELLEYQLLPLYFICVVIWRGYKAAKKYKLE